MTAVERRERAKRATMGFRILQGMKEGEYKLACNEIFPSLIKTEQYIKKNPEQFKTMHLVIVHVKKEITIKVETRSVATITDLSVMQPK